jgi:hypothetical protein
LPTPQQGSPDNLAVHTPMPVGSIDSGIGADLDDGQASRTRSSSEEKESLTPAQSRRKAQNRAAYVLLLHTPNSEADSLIANALSVSVRSDM